MAPRFTTRRQQGWTVLSVVGDIDIAGAPHLRQELRKVDEPWVILDLGGVDFMDSTGLGVLLGGIKRSRSDGGELRVVCDDDRLLSLFRLTGLDRAFTLYADVDAALAEGSEIDGAGR